jgi:hypothetical protein
VLHINREAIETHLICPGTAMTIFLGGSPVFLIIMSGRWSSDAFFKEFNHDPRCLKKEKDDQTQVPRTHPKLLHSHCVTSPSKTEKSPWQC